MMSLHHQVQLSESILVISIVWYVVNVQFIGPRIFVTYRQFVDVASCACYRLGWISVLALAKL